MFKPIPTLTLFTAISTLTIMQPSFAEEKKWHPHIDLEGKVGNKRDLGEADVFLPLWQNEETLVFGNIRGRFDNQDSYEGNYGIGIRHMLDNGWNLGGYSYFDRRKSSFGNNFNQITIGAEALSFDWDIRANAYIPVGRTKHTEDSFSSVDFLGSTITYKAGEERAMSGFDAEIGWRIPVFNEADGQQLRVYAGGYHFDDDKTDRIAGPRGRLDLTFDTTPYLWDNSRLSIGAEIQRDDPRGTQSFASMRIRIPLQNFGKKPKSALTHMERRMAAPIIRDIDIVSQAGAFGPQENITTDANGNQITLVKSSTTSGAGFKGAVEGAGANSTVVLNGDFTNVNDVSDLSDGQTIIGSGTMTVETPSGRTIRINLPSSSMSGEGDNGGGGNRRFFNMADNSSLIGITADIERSSSTAIAYIDGVQNVTIKNNTFTATSTTATAIGFLIEDSSSILFENNSTSIIANGTNGYFTGFLSNTDRISFINNTTSITGTAPTAKKYHYFFGAGNSNTNFNERGNTRNLNNCYYLGGVGNGACP